MSDQLQPDERLHANTRRYVLFTCPLFYPRGGWRDFAGWFEYEGPAKDAGEKWVKENGGTYHVVEIAHDLIVAAGLCDEEERGS